MKSYIRIYGPPHFAAIRALEKVAVSLPKVCVMNRLIEEALPSMDTQSGVVRYFASADIGIPRERCDSIVSRSSEATGENDFYFEWFKKPSSEEVRELIEAIDAGLAPTGARYTITTK